MGKVKNITPEERENALAIIKKCGLEETEQLINYYVRMQRDSNKHRKEKAQKEASDSNSVKSSDAVADAVAKKTRRLATLTAWAVFIAIVMSFVRTGFSFFIGWYILIIILAIGAFALYIMGRPSADAKDFITKDDVTVTKHLSVVCFCFIGLLWTCGPLNSNYDSGNYSNENVSDLKQKVKERGEISEGEAKILVVHYILNHMKDPNSYEPVSWGPLKKTQEIDGEGGGWNIEHEFRGTNSYGGVVTERNIYLIHKDGWVTSLDY